MKIATLHSATLALALLLATFRPAFCQPRLAPVLVEVKTGNDPVAGARVVLNELSLQTSEQGTATATLPLGPLTITVTKEGYFPAKTSLSLTEIREWRVSVELQPEEKNEEEITVFATRTDTRLQDSPLRVEVLSQEEIDEKVMMTPGDIVMMLNEMGGLRVQTTSPSLGAATVRIQGMPGRHVRFLADGLPLGTEPGGLGLLQIPPVDLGQVEVIKGVSSALYGAGATAGVVNLISRRPSSRPVHEVLFNRTTLGGTDTSLFLASPLTPHWGASFLGSGDWQQRRDIDKDGWADLPGYARGVLRPRIFWDNGDGSTALLTGGFTLENREGGTLPSAALPATGQPWTETLDTRRYDVGGNLQTILRKRYVVASRFTVSRRTHKHLFDQLRERDRNELLFGELSVRGTWGRNTWVAGVAAERETFSPLDVPRFARRYTTPGVFLQDDLNLAAWLSVSVSGRADFHSQYGTFLSPRISALLRWEGWISRLSAGQGFFAPTPLTEDTEAAGLSRLVIPATLLAERARSMSFDLTRKLGPVSFTGTLFGSTVSHPLNVVRDTSYQLTNLARPATNRGFEFLATLRKSPFSATASYTFVQSRRPDGEQRVDTPLTPRHAFGLVGMWEKEKVGRFGVESYYTGSQRLEQNPWRSLSKPYTLFGLLAERKVGPASLFVNVENLTNVRQTRWDPLLRPAPAVDGRWTVDAWAPLDGRVLNAGIRLRF